MKIGFRRALLAILLAAWCLPELVRTQINAPRSRLREQFQGRDVAAGEVLVRFRAGTLASADAGRQVDADDDRPVGAGGWRRMHSATRDVPTLMTVLSRRPDVVEVEPNYIVEIVKTPNDPAFSALWGLKNNSVPGADLHATAAWDVSTGSAANVVAVIDSGVDYTHADLAANMWSAPSAFTVTVAGRAVACPAGSHGFNAIAFTQGLPASAVCNPGDDNSHGTHVAGTIGAVGNNGIGVAGVNWTTRIMALKFLDASGSGTTADAINAIDFSIQVKASFAPSSGANVRVLSNSWGGGGNSSALASAIARAATADMLFVAAAGNAGSNNDAVPFYPASYTAASVVSVAATTESDARASFSNYGAASVDLGAPGTNTYSTVPGGGYGYKSGTSMATPHVAGAAALVLSACTVNTAQLKALLLTNADIVPALTGITVTGGRLNVDRAIRGCATLPSVTMTSPLPGATYTAPASISLAADASDPNGISRVEFYQGTTLIGTATTSPYGGTWTNVAAGDYTLTAKAYDGLGVSSVSAPVQVTVMAGGAGARINVALAANGATATGSTTYSSGFAASGAINGDRKGQGWGSGGGWNDGTPDTWPDWLLVEFSGLKTIDEVDVFTVQDNYPSPVEPSAGQTFGVYGLRDFSVLYWDGGAWQVVPGGSVTGNNLVWRTVRFTPLATTKILIYVTGALNTWSRIAEVEAYQAAGPADIPPTVMLTSPAEGASYSAPATINMTANATDSDGTIARVEFFADGTLVGSDTTSPYQATFVTSAVGGHTLTSVAFDNLGVATTSAPVHVTVTGAGGTRTNVALAANGGTTLASSTYNGGFAGSGAINGDRAGRGWGSGGGWNDGTSGAWPDWLEVDFNGLKTIDEVDVFTVQDNYSSPVEPAIGQTFSLYGLQDFYVLYWDGLAWQVVPGGSVTGNNLVWRTVTFAPLATTKILIYVTGALNTWSRITEVEAYQAAGTTVSPITASVHAAGLARPVAIVQDPTDPLVQFVVEQGGHIRVIASGAVLPADFLDLSAVVASDGERGLLGLAFAPDYASSGRFYVNFTNAAGNTVVARFKRSSNPRVADPSSRFDLRWGGAGGLPYIAQPFSNHNGGHLAFGPDGFLYIGLGDGGSADDPGHRAQNPFEFLGKMLRIDVNVADGHPSGYLVPGDNPFVSGSPVAALPEIWSFGLRNPWRYSFDDPARGGTGALVIADVGQGQWEEIDYEPANRGGRNYGWRNREGAHGNVTSQPPAFLPLTDPIHEYDHATGQSITGGVVYRGSALGAAYRGRYFFADFIRGRVWSMGLAIDPATGNATPSSLVEHTAELGGAALGNISAFGVDSAGELYIVNYAGTILRVGIP